MIIKCLCTETNKEYQDKIQHYKNIELCCNQKTIYLAMVFMNDIEYNNLCKLNIKIQNTVPNPVCFIFNKTKIKLFEDSLLHLNRLFEIFMSRFIFY